MSINETAVMFVLLEILLGNSMASCGVLPIFSRPASRREYRVGQVKGLTNSTPNGCIDRLYSPLFVANNGCFDSGRGRLLKNELHNIVGIPIVLPLACHG